MVWVCIGDRHAHNFDWRGLPNRMTQVPQGLEPVCATHGLPQMLGGPTRGESRILFGLRGRAFPGKHDKGHRVVIPRPRLHLAAFRCLRRGIYDFRIAD